MLNCTFFNCIIFLWIFTFNDSGGMPAHLKVATQALAAAGFSAQKKNSFFCEVPISNGNRIDVSHTSIHVQKQESALLWHQKWEPKSWKICEIIRIQKQQPSYLLSFLHNSQPIKKTLLNTDLGDMPIPHAWHSRCEENSHPGMKVNGKQTFCNVLNQRKPRHPKLLEESQVITLALAWNEIAVNIQIYYT